MPYSGQYLKISYLFIAENTDEIADTSINYSSAVGWTGAAAALAEIADDVSIGSDLANELGDLLLITQCGWADYSELVGVKVAAKGTNGLDLVTPYQQEVTPILGVTNNVPPQSTVVLSLQSGFTLGKGNYGRMYLPHTMMPLSPGYPIAAEATRDAVAAAGKTFVNNTTDLLNALTTATLFPTIMSQSTDVPISKLVGQVAVGGVNDTQRRRRNRIPEVYSVEPLA